MTLTQRIVLTWCLKYIPSCTAYQLETLLLSFVGYHLIVTYGNEIADSAARKGATKSNNYLSFPILPSVNEKCRSLESSSYGKMYKSTSDRFFLNRTLEATNRKLQNVPLYHFRQQYHLPSR